MNAMSVIFSVFIPEGGQKDPHATLEVKLVIYQRAAGLCGKNDRSDEKTAFKIKQEIVVQLQRVTLLGHFCFSEKKICVS